MVRLAQYPSKIEWMRHRHETKKQENTLADTVSQQSIYRRHKVFLFFGGGLLLFCCFFSLCLLILLAAGIQESCHQLLEWTHTISCIHHVTLYLLVSQQQEDDYVAGSSRDWIYCQLKDEINWSWLPACCKKSSATYSSKISCCVSYQCYAAGVCCCFISCSDKLVNEYSTMAGPMKAVIGCRGSLAHLHTHRRSFGKVRKTPLICIDTQGGFKMASYSQKVSINLKNCKSRTPLSPNRVRQYFITMRKTHGIDGEAPRACSP